LSQALGASVEIELERLCGIPEQTLTYPPGRCLDGLDIDCQDYLVNPSLLGFDPNDRSNVEESLYSNLFRSNCPVTHLPDWSSVQVHYQGRKISRSGLLRYLISYRNHEGFHEQCIEQIYHDIMLQLRPDYLYVRGYFSRRGGICINPIRASRPIDMPVSMRTLRQ